MEVSEHLKKIDQKYGWSFLGFILAIIFGGIAIYTEFFRDLVPDLRYEIITNAGVLDVREELPKLEILYDGKDISKTKKSLRVIVLRVVNRGTADILTAHYDARFPLGYSVIDGELIRTEVLSTSNEYLAEALRFRQGDKGTTLIEPVIIEKNQWFALKLLVLHPNNLRPFVLASGKVAGDPSIDVVDTTTVDNDKGFWVQTFTGGIWTQIVRLVFYFAALVVLVVSIVVPIVFLGSWLSKRNRKKRVFKYKDATKLNLSNDDEYIFEGYIENNIQFLHNLMRAASDDQLTKRVETYEKQKEEDKEYEVAFDHLVVSEAHSMSSNIFRLRYPIKDMKDKNFLIKQEDRWIVASERKRALTGFLEFLEYVGAA